MEEATKDKHKFIGWNTKPDGSGTDILNYGACHGPVTFYAIYYKSDYEYVGYAEAFTAPVDGWYSLETWGAKGSSDHEASESQYGGYSKGEVWLKRGEQLYVVVGQRGVLSADFSRRAYNGGGSNCHTGNYGAGGGGATHIAKGSGLQLWEYRSASNASNYVLLCAGGSGGLSDYAAPGGGGGGINGNTGAGGNRGGSQSTGYTFGRGEDGNGQKSGGGGGWYGGYASGGVGEGAGGGSGWLNPSLRNASTRANTPNPVDGYRHGYARIILIR